MNSKERVIKYLEYKGIRKSEFYLSTGLSNGFLDKTNNIGADKLEIIISKYPDINLGWVISGKGEMILKPGLSDQIRILPIVTDKKNKENIVFVPVKAIAGYLNGYQDPEFIKELPSFSLVGFTNGTYRAFEVSGDSMHPVIRDKSIVVGQYLENFFETKKDRYYVIKTKTELVVKSIINELKKTGDIILVSKNAYFEPYILPAHDIEEIWEIKVIISTPFNSNENEISSRIDELEKQLNSLRKKLK